MDRQDGWGGFGMSPGRDIWMASSLPRRKRVRALAYQVIVVRLPKLDEVNLAISIVIKDILSYINRIYSIKVYYNISFITRVSLYILL
jgi:hypothetical protein